MFIFFIYQIDARNMQCNIKPASKSKGNAAVSPYVHDPHCVRPGPCVRRRVPLQQAARVLQRQHLISKFRAMANPSRLSAAARRAQLHPPNALLAKRHLGNTFIMQRGLNIALHVACIYLRNKKYKIQPASPANQQPASQPANQPASQPAKQPANQPAQPAQPSHPAHPPSQPATRRGEYFLPIDGKTNVLPTSYPHPSNMLCFIVVRRAQTQ